MLKEKLRLFSDLQLYGRILEYLYLCNHRYVRDNELNKAFKNYRQALIQADLEYLLEQNLVSKKRIEEKKHELYRITNKGYLFIRQLREGRAARRNSKASLMVSIAAVVVAFAAVLPQIFARETPVYIQVKEAPAMRIEVPASGTLDVDSLTNAVKK